MAPSPTPQQLSALRRRAISRSPATLIASIQSAGLPADLVPLAAASSYVGITITHLRKRIRDGSLLSYRVGQRHLVSLAQLVSLPSTASKAANLAQRTATEEERQAKEERRAAADAARKARQR